MRKFFVTTLILLLALSQAVCAEFSPADSSVYYSAYAFDFTRANEEAGKFALSGNGNTALRGDGYTKSYLLDNAEKTLDGIKLTSLQDDLQGNGYGLVHGNGFRIPEEYAGFAGAANTAAVYVKEFTFDVSGLSAKSVFRIRDFSGSSLIYEIIVTNSTVALNKSGRDAYIIPPEERSNLKITIAFIPNYNNWGAATAVFVNDKVYLSSDIYANAVKKDYLPTGRTELYFFSCVQNDSLTVKNFRSFIGESLTGDDAVSKRELFNKVTDIDFDMNAVADGKLVLPDTLGIGFKAENNETVSGDAADGLKLITTEAGGLPNITIAGGKGSPFWYGTNAGYTHYWEFTADISQLGEWDGYRINYCVLNGSSAEKVLCTLAVGRKYIGLGYGEDTTDGEAKPGFVGEYIVPAGTDLTDARIGVSYDPATKELKALLNGEVVISGINHAYDNRIDTWYPCGGSVSFCNFYNEPEGAAFVLKKLNCGYYLTAARPAEGKTEYVLSNTAADGETVSATATLSKEGDSGYYNSVNLLVAIYGADGSLKTVSASGGRISGGETGKEISAVAHGYAEGDTAKAFLLEKGTIKPLV